MQYSSRTCTTTTRKVSPIWCSFDGHLMGPDRRSTSSAARIASRRRASRISCSKFTAHIADAFIQSGEVAQRHSELKERTAGGPAELINTITFQPTDDPQVVWSKGGVKVSAIRSAHIAGHASYRVDTPAGSVVIGGDAGNDAPAPPRSSSAGCAQNENDFLFLAVVQRDLDLHGGARVESGADTAGKSNAAQGRRVRRRAVAAKELGAVAGHRSNGLAAVDKGDPVGELRAVRVRAKRAR